MISILKRYFNSSRLSYLSKTYKVILIRYDIVANINYLNKLGFNIT